MGSLDYGLDVALNTLIEATRNNWWRTWHGGSWGIVSFVRGAFLKAGHMPQLHFLKGY